MWPAHYPEPASTLTRNPDPSALTPLPRLPGGHRSTVPTDPLLHRIMQHGRLLRLVSFSVFKAHPCCSMNQYFLVYSWITLYYIDTSHFIYPFVNYWIFGLFPFRLPWIILLWTRRYKFLCRSRSHRQCATLQNEGARHPSPGQLQKTVPREITLPVVSGGLCNNRVTLHFIS